MYIFFNYFQKSFYEYRSIFILILKKFHIIFLSNISLCLLFILKNTFLNYLVSFTLAFQLIYIIKKTKVFLKITKRIIRLFITVVFEIVVFSLFIPYLLLDLLIPILIIFADFINKPIETLIRNKFINKARNKIKDSKAIKIAITGSYGKTSVKHYLSSVLKQKYLIKNSPKSYNTPLGIAKFINEEDFSYIDFVLYEFGARRVGDISELKRYYSYDIAIVTGIGKMHIDTFKTQEAILKEKMNLVETLNKDQFAILNYENEFIRKHQLSCTKYTYGFDYGDYQAKNLELSIFSSKFDLYYLNNYIRSFEITLLGRSAVLNVMPAIVFCHLYNLDYCLIEHIKSVDNRLSLRTFTDYYILDDAYNSNILGASYALEVLKSHNGKKYIITPGFAEMDLIKEELAIEYAKNIEGSADHCILVKNSFTTLLAKYILGIEVSFVESFKEGFKLFINIKESNSVLLIENDLLE